MFVKHPYLIDNEKWTCLIDATDEQRLPIILYCFVESEQKFLHSSSMWPSLLYRYIHSGDQLNQRGNSNLNANKNVVGNLLAP